VRALRQAQGERVIAQRGLVSLDRHTIPFGLILRQAQGERASFAP
jgi:hypothetical protein